MPDAADDITIMGNFPKADTAPPAPETKPGGNGTGEHPPGDSNAAPDTPPAGRTPTEELDGEVLAKGWAAFAARKPVKHAVVSWAARTDMGRVREHNEDKFDFFDPEDPTQLAMRGRLWAVADGMGGHSAGQIAAEWALKTLIRSYYSPSVPDDAEQALQMALSEANTLIFNAARKFEKANGMGTTLVVAVVKEDVLTLAHVGDSRAYLLRTGQPMRQITVDHSWIEEQVRHGMLSRAEAEASPYRNFITRSVGIYDVVEADVLALPVQKDDIILLCSDGLSNYLDEAAMTSIIQGKSLSRATLDLIDAANVAGGKDNITALLLKVHSIGPYGETDRG
ncbi:MAG: hypothetical protein OHK0029_17330 [Armatimonadaceae bacterium]